MLVDLMVFRAAMTRKGEIALGQQQSYPTSEKPSNTTDKRK